MSEYETTSTEADLDALKALQADASELVRIESLLDRFNVFEAIGFVGQEIKHSRFLAFLLDPRQNHGLGDHFLKRFLREASASTDETSLPSFPENLDEIDLGQTLVRREHQHVDILLTNEVHRFAVIIENKIWTTEHSDQLSRYYGLVKDSHPGWQTFGIYLTPFGDNPSHEAYLPLSYGTMCGTIDNVLKNHRPALQPEVSMSLAQYVRMLRRHIVNDPEIVELCRSLYRKHRRAFDLVYEHRPNRQADIRSWVEDIVRNEPKLEWDSRAFGNDILRFAVREWDQPALLRAKWTRSGRILLFEFWNHLDKLQLKLILGPGPEDVRKRVLSLAQSNPDIFGTPHNYVGSHYEIFNRVFLTGESYENSSTFEAELQQRWTDFLREDLPRIDEALKQETWVWESGESNDERSSQESTFVWGDGDIAKTNRREDEE